MIRYLIVLFTLLLPLNVSAIVLDGIDHPLTSHPRILIDDLSSLQAKAVVGNDYWEWIVDRGMSAPTPTYPVNDGDYVAQMAQLAIMYLIDPVAYADEGTAAKTMLLAMSTYYGISDADNQDYGSIHSLSMACTYDWVYPLLSTSDKTTFISWLNSDFYPMLALHTYTTWNLRLTKMMGYLSLGLATFEDNPTNEAIVTDAWVEWMATVKPSIDEGVGAGHNFSGSAYGHNRVWPYHFNIIHILDTALGIDQYPEWIDESVHYAMLELAPTSTNLYYSEGNVGNPVMSTSRAFIGFFHSLYLSSDTVKAGGYNFLNTKIPQTSVSNSAYFLDTFLWLDSRETASDYTTKQPAIFADGTDIILSKSDWTATATWVGFTASNWLGDHQGKNAGSYKIYKNEHLIVEESDTYNSLDVIGNNTIWLDDGYIRDLYATTRFNSSWEYNTQPIANIDRENITNNYIYARGNLTGLFVDNVSMKKVDSDYRSILHIGDYIVVADNITTTSLAGSVNGVDNNLEVEKTNYIHYKNTPSISGNTITSTGLVSRVSSDVLLPTTATITTTSLTNSTRVEIQQPTLAQHNKFLIVHRVGGTTSTVSASLIVGTGGQGALFDNTAVLFTASTLNADIGSLSYTTDATTHYIADLPINTDVEITRGGVSLSDINSGDAGIIEFTATSGSAEYIVTAGTYVAPIETCSDGIQNQDETGIDCGGSCDACETTTTHTAFTMGAGMYILKLGE